MLRCFLGVKLRGHFLGYPSELLSFLFVLLSLFFLSLKDWSVLVCSMCVCVRVCGYKIRTKTRTNISGVFFYSFLKTFQREHPEEILAGEFLLFRGVRFSIDVKHPFRALRGAAMELRSLGDIDAKRIDDAERRARQILRFSPLMTDAYFHYTPSQIMMAALSLADRGLAERLIQATFHYVSPPADSEANTPAHGGGVDTPTRDGSGGGLARNKPAAPDQATIIGSYIRDRVLGTIESCRDMLNKELPERREHWADVSD